MSVYLIVDITVTDPEPYAEYVARARPILERYGGRYLVRGGPVTPLSGDWHPKRIVLIEFPEIGELRRCFGSAEYREIAPLRERSTSSRSIVVEGLAECLSS